MGLERQRVPSDCRPVRPRLERRKRRHHLVPVDKQRGKRRVRERRLHRHAREPPTRVEPLRCGDGQHGHFERHDPLCKLGDRVWVPDPECPRHVKPQYSHRGRVLRERRRPVQPERVKPRPWYRPECVDPGKHPV